MSVLEKKSKILIVEDHPVVRKGLSFLIQGTEDLAVCGESDEGSQVGRLIDQCQPDAVILDLSLKDGSGLETLKDIRKRFSTLPVLVFSASEESHYVERVLRAGAMGYLNKAEAWDRVVNALREILQGRVYASEESKNNLLRKISTFRGQGKADIIDLLSDRELEVFRLLGEGYSTREIAAFWRRSVKTVETYRANIKRKLQLKKAQDLIREAVQWLKIRV